MSINWFEIAAQIVNFFLILFILQKLLYKPVLKAMAERQKKTLQAQVEADKKMDKAIKLIDQYERRISDIEKEKRSILDDAKNQANEIKESLLEKYMVEAEAKRKAYLKEIEDEKFNFTKYLRENLASSAIKVASHILDSISSKELDKEIFNSFVNNLKNLQDKVTNFEIIKEETVNINSFRELTKTEKATIERILKEDVGIINDINYKKDPNLILGFELNLETYTVHANAENYLREIEKEIIKNLNTN